MPLKKSTDNKMYVLHTKKVCNTCTFITIMEQTNTLLSFHFNLIAGRPRRKSKVVTTVYNTIKFNGICSTKYMEWYLYQVLYFADAFLYLARRLQIVLVALALATGATPSTIVPPLRTLWRLLRRL